MYARLANRKNQSRTIARLKEWHFHYLCRKETSGDLESIATGGHPKPQPLFHLLPTAIRDNTSYQNWYFSKTQTGQLSWFNLKLLQYHEEYYENSCTTKCWNPKTKFWNIPDLFARCQIACIVPQLWATGSGEGTTLGERWPVRICREQPERRQDDTDCPAISWDEFSFKIISWEISFARTSELLLFRLRAKRPKWYARVDRQIHFLMGVRWVFLQLPPMGLCYGTICFDEKHSVHR